VVVAYAQGKEGVGDNTAKLRDFIGGKQYQNALGGRKMWSKLVTCYLSNSWTLETWRISSQTSRATMAMFSLLSHLAGVVATLGEQASPFQSLIFSPRTHLNCFLPSMPDDPRQCIARMLSYIFQLATCGLTLCTHFAGEYMQRPGSPYLGKPRQPEKDLFFIL
jgi:hypothetical protein